MILYRCPLPSLSANKGVNQQVMRFTPFSTPEIFVTLENFILLNSPVHYQTCQSLISYRHDNL